MKGKFPNSNESYALFRLLIVMSGGAHCCHDLLDICSIHHSNVMDYIQPRNKGSSLLVASQKIAQVVGREARDGSVDDRVSTPCWWQITQTVYTGHGHPSVLGFRASAKLPIHQHHYRGRHPAMDTLHDKGSILIHPRQSVASLTSDEPLEALEA